jgi:hypothetical protein
VIRPIAITTLPDPTGAPAAERRRRVGTVLLALVGLSVVDLLLTLGFMTSVGMYEDNPIAVWLVRWTGTTQAVAAFKVASLAVAVGVLYALRSRPQGEVGAWLALTVLVLVTLQWARYADCIGETELMALAELGRMETGWVQVH